MHKSLVAMTLASLIILTAACGPSEAGSAPAASASPSASTGTASPSRRPTPHFSSTPSATPRAADTTLADVRALILPQVCGYAAGTRLSGGSYTKYSGSDIVENAEATLKDPAPVFTDINGDGAKEALVFLQCNHGKRIPGDLLLAVGSGGNVISTANLDPVFHASQVRGTAMTVGKGGVDLTVTAGPGDLHGRAAFAGGRLVVTQTTSSGDEASSISLDGATFTSAGFGPLKLGAPASDYPGYINADATNDDDVDGPKMPDGLHAYIGSAGTVTAVWTESSRFSSRSGARVGMSVSQLRKLYPGSALEEATIGTQSPEQALALIDSSGHGLYFVVDWNTRSKVTAMYAAATSKDGHIDHLAT